ncbi:unnamed protein product, partial [Ectocarpus sp. 12 AP-2014]
GDPDTGGNTRANDRAANDRAANDRVANDRVSNDRGANDRVANDRVANDRVANDRVANDRSPTTESPTTEAPTTEAPTTEAPTTESPTTESPTTESPTTASPPTESPTTESPTTGPTPEPTPEPGTETESTCSDGIEGIDGNGVVCCPLGCGQCGGAGCSRAGAANGLNAGSCCGGGIKYNGNYCDDTGEAPCIYGSAPEADDGDGTCSDGIEGIDGNGVVCCPLGCDQCGGTGCFTAGAANGLDSGVCCKGSIKSSGNYCDDTGEAPCIYGSAPDV